MLEANRRIREIIADEEDSWLYTHAQSGEEGIGAGGDRSLNIDLAAEKVFVDLLSGYGRINSEESGVIGSGESEIVLDPIDGSANIASGFPYFGTSVSLNRDGKSVCSVVANLANGDVFYRDERGLFEGKLDKKGFVPTTIREKAQVGLFEKAYSSPEVVAKLHGKYKFRSPGAIALSLAYAHRVNFVLFIGKHRTYDICGGLHLCSDLYTKVTENVVLVSRDKERFDTLHQILFGKDA